MEGMDAHPVLGAGHEGGEDGYGRDRLAAHAAHTLTNSPAQEVGRNACTMLAEVPITPMRMAVLVGPLAAAGKPSHTLRGEILAPMQAPAEVAGLVVTVVTAYAGRDRIPTTHQQI